MEKLKKTVLLLPFIAITLIITNPWVVGAESLTASLANMPQSAEIDKTGKLTGAYVELIRALDNITDSKTKIVVAPFKRSILNLIDGRVDFHIPLIEPPDVNSEELPYSFSTITLFQVAFVLYTNKNKTINIDNLKQYNIATDSAHTDFFDFPTQGISCLLCAIKMLDAGRLDGFIFAQNEIDPFIKEYNLKNIHRRLYKNFNVKILLPKGKNREKIDQYFTKGIKALQKQGKYKSLLAPILTPYQEWQP
jgi:polar amino acid transport system substrate-binding protein